MVAKAKEHYLPLFVGDFLASTALWTGPERGLYLQLLALQWTSGPLPCEPQRIASALQYHFDEFQRLWPTVASKFHSVDGVLRNQRLEEHRERVGAIQAERSKAGKSGATRKWVANSSSGKTRAERLANARKLGTHSIEQWHALLDICGDLCLRCGDAPENGFVKDHIIPIYQGGSDSIENIQPLCRRCNAAKGSDTSDLRPHNWASKMPGKMPGEMPSKRLLSDPIRSDPSETSQSLVSGETRLAPSAVDQVFDHWRTVWDHGTAKLDPKRRATITRALKAGYSQKDLCEAISGYKNSPHHTGQNDRNTVYDGLGLLLRDAEHIDAGLRFARMPPSNHSDLTNHNVAVLQSWTAQEHDDAANGSGEISGNHGKSRRGLLEETFAANGGNLLGSLETAQHRTGGTRR